jgi:hypothetical protein
MSPIFEFVGPCMHNSPQMSLGNRYNKLILYYNLVLVITEFPHCQSRDCRNFPLHLVVHFNRLFGMKVLKIKKVLNVNL